MNTLRAHHLFFVVASAVGVACASSEESAPKDPTLALLGGATTIFDDSRNAFTFAARNLNDEERNDFSLGDHFFNRNWVTAPASTVGDDGLGPTFNATSCSECHFRDGRGAPPKTPDEKFDALLIRLSIPGVDAHGGPLDEPTYGGQLNNKSILGVPVEATPHVSYTEVPGQFGDGEPYSLQRPVYTFTDFAFGPFAAETMFSPRIAPAMIGLGLLEAIPEADLEQVADEADRDGDGISGRLNHVWDVRKNGLSVGRFGWKSNQPTVEQQMAGAFLGDIGITSDMFPHENCPSVQSACSAAPHGIHGTDLAELSTQKFNAVARYCETLAVPARREVDNADALYGETLFDRAKCGSCHVKKWVTGARDSLPALSNQTIRPFTDLLLHDMGPDLADGRPDFEATGQEWRTSPLWGIGLQETVSRHNRMLHDGRARGMAEAILWHGGESEESREIFRNMSKSDRNALLYFLGTL